MIQFGAKSSGRAKARSKHFQGAELCPYQHVFFTYSRASPVGFQIAIDSDFYVPFFPIVDGHVNDINHVPPSLC